MQRSWKNTGFIQWEILPDVPSEKKMSYIMTVSYTHLLAAFDSAKYERVLFVAHREEILKQAAVSFKHVRHSDDYGFFDGKQKDTGKSVIFASVATLGRSEYLTEEYFAPDYFCLLYTSPGDINL